ncbi:hypothetical protein NDU88_003348 [Pleurodeles waltl]|uniref:Uncharacterized protein n=1 Tax=Pleurodeles waltl TaxID=8319 RepID=A0AAV7W397_PLEWA|nr:hypothetical protein NDU88_003348 [Pleurodeles waltl]
MFLTNTVQIGTAAKTCLPEEPLPGVSLPSAAMKAIGVMHGPRLLCKRRGRSRSRLLSGQTVRRLYRRTITGAHCARGSGLQHSSFIVIARYG